MKKILSMIIVISVLFFHVEYLIGEWFKYKTIIAGIRPVAIIPDLQNNFNIFCAGWDSNYNDIFEPDSGDVLASWWKIDRDTEKFYKVIDFDWGLIDVPFRPFVYKNTIFIHHNHRVESYNINTGELLDSSVCNLDAIAISVLENKIFVSLRVDENKDWVIDTNIVVIYDLLKKEILDTIPAYNYVQQTLPFNFNGENYLAVLNEGIFGQNDSKLQIVKINDNNFENIKVINVGSGGNHLSFKNEVLSVATNTSRQLHFISPIDFEIFHTIILDVSAWDGPRELQILSLNVPENNKFSVAVSTYDGYLYILEIDLEKNENKLLYKLLCDGKPEGFYYDNINQELIIANPYITGTYKPNDSVTIYKTTTNAVLNPVNELNVEIFPNPFSESLFILINNAIYGMCYNIDLISVSGQVIKSYSLTPDVNNRLKLNIDSDKAGLFDGLYLLKISDGFSVITYPLCFIN